MKLYESNGTSISAESNQGQLTLTVSDGGGTALSLFFVPKQSPRLVVRTAHSDYGFDSIHLDDLIEHVNNSLSRPKPPVM